VRSSQEYSMIILKDTKNQRAIVGQYRSLYSP
jgi:hypothetical protein